VPFPGESRFQFYAFAAAKAFARLLNAFQESFVVFELVVEPIVFGCEPDQLAGGFATSSEHNRLALGLAK